MSDRRRKKSSKRESIAGDEEDNTFSIFDGDKICLIRYCRNKDHYHPPVINIIPKLYSD